jgi:hypothetical protein
MKRGQHGRPLGSNRNPLDLIERNLIAGAIIDLCSASSTKAESGLRRRLPPQSDYYGFQKDTIVPPAMMSIPPTKTGRVGNVWKAIKLGNYFY